MCSFVGTKEAIYIATLDIGLYFSFFQPKNYEQSLQFVFEAGLIWKNTIQNIPTYVYYFRHSRGR